MANAASSSNTRSGDSSGKVDADTCWIVEVEKKAMLRKDEIPDRSSVTICRVPRSLREGNKQYYAPSLVSIGPYHFRNSDLSSMEEHKDEAVRRMQERIQKESPQLTRKSIVDSDIVNMDKTIRACYDEQIPYSPTVLAWMVTRDACFLFEFILAYIIPSDKGKDFRKNYESGFSWKPDSIFEGCHQNPSLEKLLDDILMLENQIPFFILERLLTIQMNSVEVKGQEKLQKLMDCLFPLSNKLFGWFIFTSCAKSSHLLQLMYFATNGASLQSYRAEALRFEGSQLFSYSQLSSRCCNYIPACCCLDSTPENAEEEMIDRREVKILSAAELNNSGVKLLPVLDKKTKQIGAAIQWIQFDEKTSTLYLPELLINPQSISRMRNFIAMEVCFEERYYPRPMCQFAKLMDEIIDNAEDVAVLTKAGILQNKFGSNEQVAHLFNSMGNEIAYFLDCKPIEDARRGLEKYRKRKCKILCSEIVAAYFMRVLQVLCLFYSCNPKSS